MRTAGVAPLQTHAAHAAAHFQAAGRAGDGGGLQDGRGWRTGGGQNNGSVGSMEEGKEKEGRRGGRESLTGTPRDARRHGGHLRPRRCKISAETSMMTPQTRAERSARAENLGAATLRTCHAARIAACTAQRCDARSTCERALPKGHAQFCRAWAELRALATQIDAQTCIKRGAQAARVGISQRLRCSVRRAEPSAALCGQPAPSRADL